MPRSSSSPWPAMLACALCCLIGASLPTGSSAQVAANATAGCWVVKDYWPIKTCKQELLGTICSRGWGAWNSEEVCCSPGVAFPEGCGEPLTNCWVVENFQLGTCIQDQRKCLQGYNVYPSQDSCCWGAFKKQCRNLTESATPCYVVDTYYPSKLCRSSTTLCGEEAKAAGVQSWPTQEECCAIGSAFSDGCSKKTPPTPCWVVDSYDPIQRCRMESDIAVCNRGWGVYGSEAICCSPSVAFPEGCSTPAAPTNASSLPTMVNPTVASASLP